jgi:hypothetical protein
MSHHAFRVVFLLVAGVSVSSAQEPLFGPGEKPGTSRLSVQMVADVAAVVPDRHLTLRLEMVPAPGIHVYAPGNVGYIPVTVDFTPRRGVQLQPTIFPPAEDYLFGELKEKVKVYTRPFQVKQLLTVSREAAKTAGSTITFAGTVRYQACDDKVCFRPASVPVSVTLPISTPSTRLNAPGSQ